jgi:hypothetical protein
LPELEVELQNLLKITDAQISKLPKAPSEDAQGEIVLLVSNFAREVAVYVEGTPDENGIHQLMRPLNKAFLVTIRGTAQRFCPWERETDTACSFTHPNFFLSGTEPAISNDDDEVICVDEVIEMADK